MKAPIHSRKHYVQWTLSTALTVARNTEQIAKGVAVSAKDQPSEVEEGSVIKAVYIELWTLSSSSDGSEVVIICKDNSDGTGPTYNESITLDVYNNKKEIFFVHQGLSSNDGITSPTIAFKGWIKIPKSKQRFGLGDTLNVIISNPSLNDLDYCGFATYKEYT